MDRGELGGVEGSKGAEASGWEESVRASTEEGDSRTRTPHHILTRS